MTITNINSTRTNSLQETYRGATYTVAALTLLFCAIHASPECSIAQGCTLPAIVGIYIAIPATSLALAVKAYNAFKAAVQR